MSLDFRYTCPEIDEQIQHCEDTIEHLVRHIIDTYSTSVSDESIEDAVIETWDSYKTDFLDQFEEVRTANEEMREAADEQISSLEEEITEQGETIDDMQSIIDNLKVELDEALMENA